jgi:hypothetical protein
MDKTGVDKRDTAHQRSKQFPGFKFSGPLWKFEGVSDRGDVRSLGIFVVSLQIDSYQTTVHVQNVVDENFLMPLRRAAFQPSNNLSHW